MPLLSIPSPRRAGVALLAAALFAQACRDSTAPHHGSLAGTVVLQDSWANKFSDFSGVTISIDNAPVASTDATGAWQIDAVAYGSHVITFAKPTFGTVRLEQRIADTTNTAPAVVMGVTPTQQAIIDSVRVAALGGKDYYIVDGHLSFPLPRNAIIASTVAFFGKSSAVSPDTTSYDQIGTFTTFGAQVSTFSIPFAADALHAAFGAGGQAFVVAYVSATACTCYPAQPTAKPLYTNTGPRGNVVPVTVR